MTNKIKPRVAKVAMPPVNKTKRCKIAEVRFADEIDAVKDRCEALELAIIGANHISGGEINGVSRLASDVTQGLRQIAASFRAL